MGKRIIDRIVESLASGDMSIDEFMCAVERRTLTLHPPVPSAQDDDERII